MQRGMRRGTGLIQPCMLDDVGDISIWHGGAQLYPSVPCPLTFAEEVAGRAGQPSNAHVLLSAASAAARGGGVNGGAGGGVLVSLTQALPPKFRSSWRRPPVHAGL